MRRFESVRLDDVALTVTGVAQVSITTVHAISDCRVITSIIVIVRYGPV